MNEKIKQLAEHAGIFRPKEFYQHIDALQLEKFAELIVKECQHRVEQYINECGEVASMPESVIMKHFGVEE